MSNPLFGDQTEDTVQIDPSKDYLPELVGEDKKFKTPADLARAKLEADSFIERLKRENATLRNELNGKLSMEQFLDRLEQQPSPTPPQTPAHQQVATEPTSNTQNKPLTQEDIEKYIAERERKLTEERNLSYVASELEKAYGANFQQRVAAKAKELDLSPEFFTNIAKERPNAFLKLMGEAPAPKAPEAPANPRSLIPASSVNSAALNQNAGKPPKTFKDFEQLRKTDPRTYFSASTQNEMYRMAAQYGDAFYN